jgi:hypothetical protein
MKIPGDPLPNQWQVVLRDGSAVGIWADAYGEKNGHYTFEILADATPEERADPDLVIDAETPSNPERILITVARIPIDLVANVYSRRWDTPVTPDDLIPIEWAPRPKAAPEE